MPTNGGGEFSPEALAHKQAYHAERRRIREQLHERRRQQREERADAAWLRRWHRDSAREARQEADQRAAEARERLSSLRSNPLHDLWRRWGRRIDNGTLYDAQVWRRTGRLVPVTQRTRYTAGGAARREVVDWTDVLDRHAQELGVDVNDLPRLFDRIKQEHDAAWNAAVEADELRTHARSAGRELVNAV